MKVKLIEKFNFEGFNKKSMEEILEFSKAKLEGGCLNLCDECGNVIKIVDIFYYKLKIINV